MGFAPRFAELRYFAAQICQTVEKTVKNKYFFARVRVELSQLTWEPRQSQSVSKSVVIRPHDACVTASTTLPFVAAIFSDTPLSIRPATTS